MSVEEIVARLRGVLHDSSKSARLLYWQAARRQQREILESRARAASAAREAGGPQATSSKATSSITPLDGVLRELDEALFGEERRRRQAGPKRLAEAASEVAGMCLLGRHEAKSIYGVHVAKSGGHIRPQSTTIDPGTYSVGGSLAGVNVRWGEGHKL